MNKANSQRRGRRSYTSVLMCGMIIILLAVAACSVKRSSYPFDEALVVHYEEERDVQNYVLLRTGRGNGAELTSEFPGYNLTSYRGGGQPKLIFFDPELGSGGPLAMYIIDGGRWRQLDLPGVHLGYDHIWYGDSHIVDTGSGYDANGFVLWNTEWTLFDADAALATAQRLPDAIMYYANDDATQLIGVHTERIFVYEPATQTDRTLLSAEEYGVNFEEDGSIHQKREIAEQTGFVLLFKAGIAYQLDLATAAMVEIQDVMGDVHSSALSPSEAFLLIPNSNNSLQNIELVSLESMAVEFISKDIPESLIDVRHWQWAWKGDETMVANVAGNSGSGYVLFTIDLATGEYEILLTSPTRLTVAGWVGEDRYLIYYSDGEVMMLDTEAAEVSPEVIYSKDGIEHVVVLE